MSLIQTHLVSKAENLEINFIVHFVERHYINNYTSFSNFGQTNDYELTIKYIWVWEIIVWAVGYILTWIRRVKYENCVIEWTTPC